MCVHETWSDDLILTIDDLDANRGPNIGCNFNNFVAVDQQVCFDTSGAIPVIVHDDDAVLQQERRA